MIKRALGLWATDGGGSAGQEVDDSDEELTAIERKKLERRLLPGSQKPTKVVPKRQKDSDDETSADEDSVAESGSEPEDGGWPSEDPDEDSVDSDDEHPVMPPEKMEEKPIRGKFHCQLCPDKILMNEKLLEAHLESKSHKKNVRRFEEAKALGVEAYTAACTARAEAREALAKGAKSKRELKNELHWEKKRKKLKRKELGAKELASKLTKEEIEKRKQHFQAKKARRKGLVEAGGAEAAESPATDNRKARRRALQAAVAPEPTASTQPRNRKDKRRALQAAFAAKQGLATAPDAADAQGKPKKKRKA